MDIILNFAKKFELGDKLEFVDSVVSASYDVARNSSEEQLKKIPIRIMHI